MGQNCAGPERFFVYEKVYTEFCDGVTRVVKVILRCTFMYIYLFLFSYLHIYIYMYTCMYLYIYENIYV
jgi:hypothetical protein